MGSAERVWGGLGAAGLWLLLASALAAGTVSGERARLIAEAETLRESLHRLAQAEVERAPEAWWHLPSRQMRERRLRHLRHLRQRLEKVQAELRALEPPFSGGAEKTRIDRD